eukprot:CAMPEP_0115277036 /NCGR_PEP_ID=MMETSP0270-20121206/57026_1 /TAXON_ID=71861 /ORGANISM="Scrippsiella trochoidea, Strain CCMP3099" /LENGTH=182 /DNA_ID=CAMNT_0002693651 /DNA_START=157 /DNA_END=702 /DNA_ORIENTATION=+
MVRPNHIKQDGYESEATVHHTDEPSQRVPFHAHAVAARGVAAAAAAVAALGGGGSSSATVALTAAPSDSSFEPWLALLKIRGGGEPRSAGSVAAAAATSTEWLSTAEAIEAALPKTNPAWSKLCLRAAAGPKLHSSNDHGSKSAGKTWKAAISAERHEVRRAAVGRVRYRAATGHFAGKWLA